LAFKKCDYDDVEGDFNDVICESEQEIEAFVKDAYFIFGYNKQDFIIDQFQNKYNQFLRVDWLTMDTRN